MSQKLRISLLLGLLLTLITGVLTAEAQDAPRPTPTPISRPPVQTGGTTTSGVPNKSIRGSVYIDMNSDGVCVNSGVAGEVPVQFINIDFVSSAGEKLATLQSGENGTYGFVDVGNSYWEVKADPDNTWVVTSQNPIYVPIGDDNPVQTGVDFCVQKADTYKKPTSGTNSGSALLPEAGAAAQPTGSTALLFVAISGMGLVLLGAGLKLRDRAVVGNR